MRRYPAGTSFYSIAIMIKKYAITCCKGLDPIPIQIKCQRISSRDKFRRIIKFVIDITWNAFWIRM
ncbi:hypothetical protein BER92_03115 [Xanthomonas fragariae]|nr:hypothetical protein BER92_03115 [Xanthomonas fragariae]